MIYNDSTSIKATKSAEQLWNAGLLRFFETRPLPFPQNQEIGVFGKRPISRPSSSGFTKASQIPVTNPAAPRCMRGGHRSRTVFRSPIRWHVASQATPFSRACCDPLPGKAAPSTPLCRASLAAEVAQLRRRLERWSCRLPRSRAR